MSFDGAGTKVSVQELIDRGVLEIGDGYRAKNAELGEPGIPFARAKNVRGGFSFEDADMLGEPGVARAGSKISQPRDVVFTSKGTVGRFAFVRPDTPTFVYSPQLCYWRVLDEQALNPRFLYFWMHSEECRWQFHALKGQTDMADYISLGDQKSIRILLPPGGQQDRISAVLTSLDDKINGNHRSMVRLYQVAQSVFQARFSFFAGVEDYDETEVGLVPRGWHLKPMSEAVEINPRVSLRKGDVAPYVEMAAVERWGVRPTTVGERAYSGGSRFEPGDTLMARITGCIEYGKGAFVDFLSGPGSGSTEFLVLRAKPPLSPEAIFLLSRDERIRAHAMAGMTGSSGRQRVPTAVFDDLLIAVPPDENAWEADAAVLRAVFAKSRCLWAESKTLASLRDALLPKLISGEIRVPDTADPDEAVAEVAGVGV